MPSNATRTFIFHQVYDMAAVVEECIDNAGSFGEVDWKNPEVLNCLIDFSKVSLLHHYVYSMIGLEHRHDYRKNSDLYEESEEMRAEVHGLLEAYGISVQPYEDYVDSLAEAQENDAWFYHWFLKHETMFEELWEKMTQEVFHLLFANRAFLLRFNKALAMYLAEGGVAIPPSFRGGRGVLKRQSHFPVWLRKAVFYRDQGRCVLCQRDLSGLISLGFEAHLDHIVPLQMWGSNDPCNIQLLCGTCNRRKSGKVATTATRYQPWWD